MSSLYSGVCQYILRRQKVSCLSFRITAPTCWFKLDSWLGWPRTSSAVIASVNAVARQRDVLVRVVERFEEGDQVLVVGELLGHWEGDHHHVDGRVALSEGTEERWDGSVQLLHGALGGGWSVAVVLWVAHTCGDKAKEDSPRTDTGRASSTLYHCVRVRHIVC